MKSAIVGSLAVVAALSGCGTNEVVEPPRNQRSITLEPPETIEGFKALSGQVEQQVAFLSKFVVAKDGDVYIVNLESGKCPPTPPDPNYSATLQLLHYVHEKGVDALGEVLRVQTCHPK